MSSSSSYEQRRQRIIKHLNDDHQTELTRYLQHFASVPSDIAASSPHLVDVSYEQLLIRAGDQKEYSIPFQPPLESWNEIRARVVEMDAVARAALDPNAVVITEYLPPSGFGAVLFTSVVGYFFLRATLGWVVPGSVAWDIAAKYFPGGALQYRWVTKTIFWPMVLLHTAEAIHFDRSRLVKNGVARGSKVWWLWITNSWIEGFTTFWRIDALIAAKKAAIKKR